MKLTYPQLFTLLEFEDGLPRGAGRDLLHVRRLSIKGLLEHQAGSGKFATWVITDAGRAALAARKEEAE